jgi:hypothetical protein
LKVEVRLACVARVPNAPDFLTAPHSFTDTALYRALLQVCQQHLNIQTSAVQQNVIAFCILAVCAWWSQVRQFISRIYHLTITRTYNQVAENSIFRKICWEYANCAHAESIQLVDVQCVLLQADGAMRVHNTSAAALSNEVRTMLEGEQ